MSTTHGIIKLRRGTAAEWAASLPQPGGEVLRLGEPGYEKDTRKLKIGNGVDGWNNLDYINAGYEINPEDIEDIIGSGFLVAGTGITLSYDDNADSLTISTSGVSLDGHSHVSNDITDFNSAVSGLLPNTYDAAVPWTANHTLVDGTRYLANDLVYESGRLYKANYDNESLPVSNTTYWTDVGPGYRLNIDGRDIQNIPYPVISVNGYSGVIELSTTDLNDFNSAVSGLIPVKDIVAGTDISIVNSSGIYTINSSNTVNADILEPDGFVNRTDSSISFNNGNRQFTIQPKSPATSYAIYSNGIKVVKNITEIITLPNTTALYFIHFNKSTALLSYKTTPFDFDTDIPVALIYYNADDAKAVFFGEERHGIRMDGATHRYLHNVFGTQYINGLSISNYSITGDGSSNSDATIAISDGLIYDEDIEANIVHSNSPSNPFEQVLYPIAQIPVYYRSGSSGAWTDTSANDYPVKTDTTIQYNLNNAGIWSASNSDNPNNNRYIAYWICATTQENAPIISIMGQRIDSSIEQAKSNNSWGNLNLNGLPIVELRPLYRIIYNTKNSLSNDAKGFLIDILDIRSHIDTVTGLVQNDHGNLYGLADDDHYQYVHIDNSRTINAIHTFSNGLNIGPSGQILFNNTSSISEGSYDNNTGGAGGISLNCGVGYQLNWQGGHLQNSIIGDNSNTPQIIYVDSPIRYSPATLSLLFNTTIAADCSSGEMFDITLIDNILLDNPINPINGKTIRFRISQDGNGNRSVTLGSKFNLPSSASPLSWSTSPNTMDILAATYHEGRDKWDIVAFVPGY